MTKNPATTLLPKPPHCRFCDRSGPLDSTEANCIWQSLDTSPAWKGEAAAHADAAATELLARAKSDPAGVVAEHIDLIRATHRLLRAANEDHAELADLRLGREHIRADSDATDAMLGMGGAGCPCRACSNPVELRAALDRFGSAKVAHDDAQRGKKADPLRGRGRHLRTVERGPRTGVAARRVPPRPPRGVRRDGPAGQFATGAGRRRR